MTEIEMLYTAASRAVKSDPTIHVSIGLHETTDKTLRECIIFKYDTSPLYSIVYCDNANDYGVDIVNGSDLEPWCDFSDGIDAVCDAATMQTAWAIHKEFEEIKND